jgi:hypothetical protein
MLYETAIRCRALPHEFAIDIQGARGVMRTQKSLLIAVGFSACMLGCAAPNPEACRLTRCGVFTTPNSAAAGSLGVAGAEVAAAGAASPTDNPQGPLPPPLAPVGGAGGTGGSGGAAEPTCEVGKFCPPAIPDPTDCGMLTLKAEVKTVEHPGNVLLVFDRSGSMDQDWNGMPKWQAAGTAMLNALKPLQDKVTIGAVLFPSPNDMQMMCADPNDLSCLLGIGRGGQSCNVNPIAAPDQVTFKPGAQAIAELQSGGSGGVPKYQPLQGGGTPTSAGILQADAALKAATLTGTTAAVIITDGEPNCSWDQTQSTTTIMNWLTSLKIKTYVVGLPGAANGGGPAILTALAQAGATTDYITPTNSMALQTKLAEIISQTVTMGFDSCTINLDPAAQVPDKLHLVIKSQGQDQDVPRMFAGQTSAAWTVSSDGKTVELLGDLCANVKAGTYESISFVFGCVSLPPLPPPPPPPVPS